MTLMVLVLVLACAYVVASFILLVNSLFVYEISY